MRELSDEPLLGIETTRLDSYSGNHRPRSHLKTPRVNEGAMSRRPDVAALR